MIVYPTASVRASAPLRVETARLLYQCRGIDAKVSSFLRLAGKKEFYENGKDKYQCKVKDNKIYLPKINDGGFLIVR